MPGEELEGCRGLIFLYHDESKRVTVKWIGKEIGKKEKSLAERTLLSLFAECACEEDDDYGCAYDPLSLVPTPAECREGYVTEDSESEAEPSINNLSDDDGDSIMDEEFYMKESMERREKLEDHELLFEALSKSDSRVINLHVDPSTGAVDVEGSDEDSDEDMEIIRMLRKTKQTTPLQGLKGLGTRLCKYCGKYFSSSDSLTKHELTHTGERPHPCTLCDKRFTQRAHLRTHLLTHTKEKPHICQYCNRGFALKATLISHELTHTGIKPHLCSVCGRAFTSKSEMKRHEALHYEDGLESTKEIRKKFMPKIHACTDCGKAFSHKRTLANHMLTHTGVKAHNCSYCGKAFALKGSKDTHELIHTGEKPHQCPICDTRFTQISHLKAHVLTHTGARPHECSICGKAFALKGNLRAHELIHIKKV
ncbi:zinc finger protein OZF-like isoform X1 [Watersipora subatra]|uniref:zinc finger protein OZF-like isoform X1 n=1 Tax=Watersipora subatra TaxID=2589382 RepID=UPI00355C0920